MLRISAVSYLNTIPFVYGLNHSEFPGEFQLNLEVPAKCAESILNGSADIALVPVGALPSLSNYQIIDSYCLGAEGNVKSVLLLSQLPLNEIKTIYLDLESRTSVELVKVLAKKLWKIQPEFKKINVNQSSDFESVVLIGDKTFNIENSYQYVFDLSGEWNRLTGLPFVFAVWVASKNISQQQIDHLNSALKFGLKNIPKAIETYCSEINFTFDSYEYLTKYISYPFDDRKKEAMKLFLEWIRE